MTKGRSTTTKLPLLIFHLSTLLVSSFYIAHPHRPTISIGTRSIDIVAPPHPYPYSPARTRRGHININTRTAILKRHMSNDNSNLELPDPSSMRIKEIKDELNEMGVSFTDCFDKDSLVTRLMDARSGVVKGTKQNSGDSAAAASSSSTSKAEEQGAAKSPSSASNFDKEAAMEELRSKKVRELRTMCAQNSIPWANMIEKEELVRALVNYQEKAAGFSKSGQLTPGKVTNLTGDVLGKEVEGGATTPLLLDVYATWCGPCKLMAPQLDEAAATLGDKVRVAKMDADANPDWAGKLRVQGLPTVIVFDGQSGKELERVEGALMRDQLIQLAEKHT